MSTTNKNKKSISETLLEMDELTKAIKKESKETISQLLSETVRGVINEAICEDDDEEYEIEDDAAIENNVEDMDEPEMGGQEDAETADDNEWDEFDDFKVGDDAYDLTGEKGDEHIVKVFKLLKDDDDIVIKDMDGTIELKDNETGAEYVIKTGCETSEPVEVESDTEIDAENEVDAEDSENEYEFEFDSETEDDSDDMGFEDDDMENDDFSEEDNNDEEDETMKEGKEMVFEIDLGYTDSYQDKDPIKGLSNNEPSKSGKSWHKGVPTGTNKPWAGKGSSKPFEKKVACCEGEDLNLDMPVDEMADENLQVENVTMPAKRKLHKNLKPQNKTNPKVGHHNSEAGDYKALEEACKKLQKENKELKAIIPQIKKAMNESVIVNYKLGRIVKLFSENTTTKKEKIDIINRFNEEAKTINETKALYESVKRELNNVKATPMVENNVSTANKTTLNETTIYQSNDVRGMIDLINRMK